jgi:hypothetical protein
VAYFPTENQFPFLYMDVVKHNAIVHTFRFDTVVGHVEFPFEYIVPINLIGLAFFFVLFFVFCFLFLFFVFCFLFFVFCFLFFVFCFL